MMGWMFTILLVEKYNPVVNIQMIKIRTTFSPEIKAYWEEYGGDPCRVDGAFVVLGSAEGLSMDTGSYEPRWGSCSGVCMQLLWGQDREPAIWLL